MSDWFSKAQKFVDNFTESIVEQANVAQAQMADEQTKIREEVAKDKMTRDGEASLPWETDDDSLAILTQDVMEKVLSLSLTEQNFTVSPPKVEVFSFLFSNHIPTAMRLLSLDANLARMHAKLSPKMDEEVFWRNYFFRVKYIRLALGIEKVGSNNSYTIMRSLREEDVICKSCVESQSKVTVTTRKEATHALVSDHSTSSRSPNASSPLSNSKTETTPSIAGSVGVEDIEERERQNSVETRRIAEAALAAEVEAELDDDDIDLTDLGDLDLGDDDGDGDDTDDFDDLGDLDDDEKLEAQIAHELAQEDEKSK